MRHDGCVGVRSGFVGPRNVGEIPIEGGRPGVGWGETANGSFPFLTMKTRFKSVVVMVAALGAAATCAIARAADADTAAVMRTKLSVAQKILGGLAMADYPLIQTNAATLVSLSGQRGWLALQTPEYDLFSTQFRLSAEAVTKAAKRRDLNASLMAYSDLTSSCVACHKYLRDGGKK